MEFFEKIIKTIKISPVAIFSICILSLISILEIDSYVVFIDLSVIRLYGKSNLSTVFMFTLIYCCFIFISKNRVGIMAIPIDFKKYITDRKRINNLLNELSNPEMQILALFVYGNDKNIPLDTSLAPIKTLIDKSIIERSRVSSVFDSTAYLRLSKITQKYLNSKNRKSFFRIADEEHKELASSVPNIIKELKNKHNKRLCHR